MSVMLTLVIYLSFGVTVLTVVGIAVAIKSWNVIRRMNRILSIAETHAKISDYQKDTTCRAINELKEATFEAAKRVQEVDKKIDISTDRIMGINPSNESGDIELMSPRFRQMMLVK